MSTSSSALSPNSAAVFCSTASPAPSSVSDSEVFVSLGVPVDDVPVSYTHLDVYKRQIVYRAFGRTDVLSHELNLNKQSALKAELSLIHI